MFGCTLGLTKYHRVIGIADKRETSACEFLVQLVDVYKRQALSYFTYQVVLEGVEGGVGKGYSNKESQQVASKTSLEKLRKRCV